MPVDNPNMETMLKEWWDAHDEALQVDDSIPKTIDAVSFSGQYKLYQIIDRLIGRMNLEPGDPIKYDVHMIYLGKDEEGFHWVFSNGEPKKVDNTSVLYGKSG